MEAELAVMDTGLPAVMGQVETIIVYPEVPVE
jgi:hypothetical protein